MARTSLEKFTARKKKGRYLSHAAPVFGRTFVSQKKGKGRTDKIVLGIDVCVSGPVGAFRPVRAFESFREALLTEGRHL